MIKMAFGELKLKRKAYTLVELLIVIIIIGILAGMMTLSSSQASDSAKASRIIAEIRTMKAAAALYKADYGSWPIWAYMGGTYVNLDRGHGDVLPDKYFDVVTVGDGYWIGAMRSASNDNYSFAVADAKDLDAGVKKAIENKAADTALYGSASMPKVSPQDTDSLQYFKADYSYIFSIISK